MEDIKTRIQKEQLLTNRKKAIMPNLSRLVANLIVLTFVSDEAYFFKSIIFAIIIYSFLWLSLEFLIGFNYEKFKILPYFPATSDLISSFIIIYLTGCGNSAFSGMLVSLVVVSALFSSDTFQSTYILLSSLIVYFLLLLEVF